MRLCFRALLDAEFDLHRAIAASDPQTAGLLAQFAVEEPSVMPNEAWRRMIERASVRSVHDIEIVIRENPERFAELEPLKGAIKVAIEDLRDTRDNERSGGAAEALLGWLIEHASGETEYAVPATNTVQGMK